jgi:hypothetical protein
MGGELFGWWSGETWRRWPERTRRVVCAVAQSCPALPMLHLLRQGLRSIYSVVRSIWSKISVISQALSSLDRVDTGRSVVVRRLSQRLRECQFNAHGKCGRMRPTIEKYSPILEWERNLGKRNLHHIRYQDYLPSPTFPLSLTTLAISFPASLPSASNPSITPCWSPAPIS